MLSQNALSLGVIAPLLASSNLTNDKARELVNKSA